MSNSHHRRNSSVKVRPAKPRFVTNASSPATVGSQLARQMVTLLGGGGSGGGGFSGSGLGGVFGSGLSGGRGGLSGSRRGSSGTAQTVQAITALTRALTSLLSAESANTSAVTANTAAKQTGSASDGVMGLLGGSGFGSEGGGGIGGIFGNLLDGFGGLLGLGSLATSLFSLFSGSSPQQILNPYIPPIPQTREVADAQGFPQAGTSADGSAITGPTSSAGSSTPPTQITVNVSAMDSQSFQDNATALASAVRTAMLNMHPINQLIRENL